MIFWQKVDVNKKATEPRVPSGLVGEGRTQMVVKGI
jgi:hypothetical protein